MAPPKRPNCRICSGPNEFHGLCKSCRNQLDRKRKRSKVARPVILCQTCHEKPEAPRSKFRECPACQVNRRKETVQKQRQKALRKSTCKCGCGEPVYGRTRYATKRCHPTVKKKYKPGRVVRKIAKPVWEPAPPKAAPLPEVIVNPGVVVKRYPAPGWGRWGEDGRMKL